MKAFDGLPTELEQKPLPQKSTILAADGRVLATFYDQNRVVVPLDQIAPIMQKAVISVEDKRFYEHAGIDVQGMARAAINTGCMPRWLRSTSAASTLSAISGEER